MTTHRPNRRARHLGIALFAAVMPIGAQNSPIIAGCPVFPADHILNTPVDKLPRDRNSATYVASIGPDRTLFADFGAGTFQGAPIGIPFIVVPGSHSKVPVVFTDYGDESDPGPYPIPADAPIEGGSQSTGDRHVLVVDRDNCVLYELFNARPQADGSWKASSGAVFNLKSNALHPVGWTSADAAGLAIVPGLVRYDEVVSGEIRHAIRFTVPRTRREYVWPATHFASTSTDQKLPPMGERFRLRGDFDMTGFSPEGKVILRALQKFGMILADNGSQWFISGAPDERWNNDRLRELRRVRGSDFEAVDTSALRVAPNSGQVKQLAASITNAASGVAGAIAPGEIVTIKGDDIGPPLAAAARLSPTGLVATELAGVQLTIAEMPSPLLYVSSTQVNAIIPYAVAGKQNVSVRLRRDNTVVSESNQPVADTAPGVFAIDVQGSAAALNQDYSLNTDANPARRGSVVMLYATGEGQTLPGGEDGRITGSSLKLTQAGVTVKIAGQNAEVLFAGSAPQLVAGVMQVNVKIPSEVPAGRASVEITAGTNQSPPGVTIAVQ